MKKVFALTILLMLGLMLVSGCYGTSAGGGSTDIKGTLQNEGRDRHFDSAIELCPCCVLGESETRARTSSWESLYLR